MFNNKDHTSTIKNIMRNQSTPHFDMNNALVSLEGLKQSILNEMKNHKNWYTRKRSQHATLSRLIRIISIIAFSSGVLSPIIFQDLQSRHTELNLDYILLAGGGLLLMLDIYLGISTSFVRFYIAEIGIEKATYEFEENWNLEMAKSSTPLSMKLS